MSHPAAPVPSRSVRHCDVAVVGGSAAGLAAALQLGRQRRSVIVIDAGDPRNAAAAHMHSFLGRDGTAPGDLLSAGRAEVRSYGGEILAGRCVHVTHADGRFRTELADGTTILARRLVIATGLADELPAIDGLGAHWGRAVIHCPFCHGYEVRDQRIVQLVTHPMGLHTAALFRQLTDRLTVLIESGSDADADADADADRIAALRAAGVDVRAAAVQTVVTGADERLAGVGLADGSRLEADAIAVTPRFRARIEPFAPLGLRPESHMSGLGDVLAVDAMGATAIPGAYAAGSVTDPSQQVLQAAAQGSRVGGIVAVDLAEEDVRAAARPWGQQADWEHRYSGERIWSGNPNGSLVIEVGALASGRALDVGAGEGGDALWLADRGWEVTASDISRRALDGIVEEAARRGLSIATLAADANAGMPFPADRYDLVSASYASIPRTPDRRGVANILAAVARGGTLIVISHDLDAMRDPRHQQRAFDPEAYLHIADFVSLIEQTPGWTIEAHEKRTRPPGSATAAHHVDDVVLRARRIG